MERVNKIITHDMYKRYLERNRKAEENRCFCRHDMGHFLDVARLAMIFALQQGSFAAMSDGGLSGFAAMSVGGSGGFAATSSGEPGGFAGVCPEKTRQAEEMIYAAALLHDIGRWKQYEDGTPHEEASAALAPEILSDCGFTKEETEQIVTAISNHRNAAVRDEQSFNGILYRADKMSRSCFCCEAEAACDWKGDKKNLVLRY